MEIYREYSEAEKIAINYGLGSKLKTVVLAMEEYAEWKVNELNKSDVIKSVCDNCDGSESSNTSGIYCEKCNRQVVW